MIHFVLGQASIILHSNDLQTKIEAGLELGNILEWSHSTSIQSYEIPTIPARPSHYVYDPYKQSNLNQDSDNDKKIKSLLESVYIDVEIGAMEVSSALLILGEREKMPLDFFKDFSSHIFDEAHHAIKVREMLESFGGLSPDLSYSNRVWNKASLGKNLLERIMIENVIEEGWAADTTIDLVAHLRSKGFPEVAAMFESINEDEIRHASIGNKWVMELLKGDMDQFMEIYDRLVEVVHPGASDIHYPLIRKASGFNLGYFRKYFKG